MNFLAHLYLSGNDEKIMVGNFIADHVKGKDFLNFGEGIQSGIKLHRLIDAYTDSHPVVEESKKRLRPHFHKYSPVIVDVFYDHFLAKHWEMYHSLTLAEYSRSAHSILEKHEHIFPERTKRMFFYMKKENWLLSYETLEGINNALTGMSRRTRFDSKMENATRQLKRDYLLFENEFKLFFGELKSYIETHINI